MTRTTTAEDLGFASPFDRLRQRGDPSAFVDVFDRPIVGPDSTGVFAQEMDFANVVRVYYPRGFASSAVEDTDINAVGVLSNAPWQGARSLRFYDRGECSGTLSWRTLGEAFGDGLRLSLDEILPATVGVFVVPGLQSVRARSISQWVLTPVLRADHSDDSFRYTENYRFEFNVDGRARDISVLLTMRIEGRFAVDEESLTFEQVSFDLDNIGTPVDPLTPLLEEFTRLAMRAILDDRVRDGINAQIGNALATYDPLFDVLTTEDCKEEGENYCFDELGASLGTLPGTDVDRFEPRNFRCVDDPASPNPTQDPGVCEIIPNVYRIHQRPDGIEVILSEAELNNPIDGDLADPFTGVLQLGGVCDRFQPVRGIDDVQQCIGGSVFELMSSGPVCGDAILPDPTRDF